MNLVGFGHEFFERSHGFSKFAIIQGANIEVEILEGVGAHLGLLSHRRGRPAQNDPLGFGHSHLKMHRLDPMAFIQFDRGGGHVGEFCDIAATAQADIGLHLLHTIGLAFADCLHRLFLPGLDQLALDAVLFARDQWYASNFAGVVPRPDAITVDASPTTFNSPRIAPPWLRKWCAPTPLIQCLCICVCVCVRVRVYVHAHVHVYMYIYTSHMPVPCARPRLPDVKLVVLLRDPVQRTYSHWRMGMELSHRSYDNSESGKGHAELNTLMINGGWEIGFWESNIFYLGVGLGPSLVKIQRPTGYWSYNKNLLAYQLGTGLGHRFTESLSGRVGYKYFSTASTSDFDPHGSHALEAVLELDL